MARLPKDYSRHENKLFFGLSLKSLMIICTAVALAFFVYKLSFIHIVIRFILTGLIVTFSLFCVFYKTEDGDDFISYLFTVIAYYSSPKYLVYKKQLNERNESPNYEKKDR